MLTSEVEHMDQPATISRSINATNTTDQVRITKKFDTELRQRINAFSSRDRTVPFPFSQRRHQSHHLDFSHKSDSQSQVRKTRIVPPKISRKIGQDFYRDRMSLRNLQKVLGIPRQPAVPQTSQRSRYALSADLQSKDFNSKTSIENPRLVVILWSILQMIWPFSILSFYFRGSGCDQAANHQPPTEYRDQIWQSLERRQVSKYGRLAAGGNGRGGYGKQEGDGHGDALLVRDAIFVSIDLEWYYTDEYWKDGRCHPVLTEVGISTFDTRAVLHPGLPPENMISTTHYYIGEPPRSPFLFGRTEVTIFDWMKHHLYKIFQIDRVPDAETRHIILVGHNVLSDINVLKLLGIDLRRSAAILKLVDTEMLSVEVLSPQCGRKLRDLASSFGMRAGGFHNAGNDANITLRVMLLLALNHCEDMQMTCAQIGLVKFYRGMCGEHVRYIGHAP